MTCTPGTGTGKKSHSDVEQLSNDANHSLIVASQISPISIAARLSPYIIGSGTITVYSPHLQVLVETLDYMKKDQNYLAANLTESWTRTYQVLPGRTHPMMSTSGTGGYLLNAVRM